MRVGFQDLIFILNCSRVSEIFISKGTVFHIFGLRYLSALKPRLTILLILTENQFVSEGYSGYSSVQKFHALSEQLDYLLF